MAAPTDVGGYGAMRIAGERALPSPPKEERAKRSPHLLIDQSQQHRSRKAGSPAGSGGDDFKRPVLRRALALRFIQHPLAQTQVLRGRLHVFVLADVFQSALEREPQ